MLRSNNVDPLQITDQQKNINSLSFRLKSLKDKATS